MAQSCAIQWLERPNEHMTLAPASTDAKALQAGLGQTDRFICRLESGGTETGFLPIPDSCSPTTDSCFRLLA